MSVRAVIFDLGKVLVDFDYGIAARRLAEHSRATADEVRAIIDQTPLLFRYEGGQMTTAEFFDAVRGEIGFTGDFPTFAAAFADIFTEIPEMTRLHAELRARGLPTFILSNTNDIAIGHVRRNFPFFSGFTGYVLSYECGALKPHERIYRRAEERSGCRGAEILFLDDKPENVAAAEKLGWQTICHATPAVSIPAVQSLLT